MITSGEGQIKESNNIVTQNTIDQEYQNFEETELGLEQDIINKMRLLSRERTQGSFNATEALQQLNMHSRYNRNFQQIINVNTQQAASVASSLNELKGVHKQLS